MLYNLNHICKVVVEIPEQQKKWETRKSRILNKRKEFNYLRLESSSEFYQATNLRFSYKVKNITSIWATLIIIIIIIIIIIWFVRLLALAPLLAYCASLGC
jgi:hypothetical protein